MALNEEDIQTAFDEEAGDAASLASDVEVRRWFNEGAARLDRYTATIATLTWAAGDLSVDLPADLHSINKIDFNASVVEQSFRTFGDKLVIDSPYGATAAGTARLLYWARRPALVAIADSPMTDAEDYACIYYALHRFYRKLVSNRALFMRYSTMLGQNAASMSDLQGEADRLLQDFVDARSDLAVQDVPAAFYGC
jgi:hypothetical protein